MSKTPNDMSLQSTKQMLDELDALMERMLSMPVDGADEAPAATEEGPTLGAKLTMLTSPPPTLHPRATETLSYQTQPTNEPAKQTLTTNPPLNPPHFVPPVQAPMPMTHSEPPPLTNEVVPPTILPTLTSLLTETQGEAAPVTAQYGYLPLVWINQGFDAAVAQLPAGGLWQTTVGRMLLGFMGIALTAVAAGWLWKDWVGWTR